MNHRLDNRRGFHVWKHLIQFDTESIAQFHLANRSVMLGKQVVIHNRRTINKDFDVQQRNAGQYSIVPNLGTIRRSFC